MRVASSSLAFVSCLFFFWGGLAIGGWMSLLRMVFIRQTSLSPAIALFSALDLPYTMPPFIIHACTVWLLLIIFIIVLQCCMVSEILNAKKFYHHSTFTKEQSAGPSNPCLLILHHNWLESGTAFLRLKHVKKLNNLKSWPISQLQAGPLQSISQKVESLLCQSMLWTFVAPATIAFVLASDARSTGNTQGRERYGISWTLRVVSRNNLMKQIEALSSVVDPCRGVRTKKLLSCGNYCNLRKPTSKWKTKFVLTLLFYVSVCNLYLPTSVPLCTSWYWCFHRVAGQ